MPKIELMDRADEVCLEMQQLLSLMELYQKSYLEVSTDMAVRLLPFNYANQQNIMNLMHSVLETLSRKLLTAVEDEFAVLREEQDEALKELCKVSVWQPPTVEETETKP